MYLVGFILGGIIAMFLLSKLIGFIAFRKITPPKKQIVSVFVAFIIATILAGYGLADGGPPKFLIAAIEYGIASIILLSIQLITFYIRKNAANKSLKNGAREDSRAP